MSLLPVPVLILFGAGFRILIDLLRVRIQGFDDQKLNKLYLNNNLYFFDQIFTITYLYSRHP
jgi:hypothetical protein